LTGTVVSSEQLADAQAATGGEAVISLDGTTLSEEQLTEVRRAFASEVPEDIDQL
jgi:glutamate dehydrogenase/leucine dehydrogenase